MRNKLKTYSFLHFAVLCCFIVGIYSTTILSADQSFCRGQPDLAGTIIPLHLLIFSSLLAKSENIVYGADSSSPSSEKNTLNDFSFCSKEAEIVLFSSFIKHINFFKKFVLPFQSTDIIYPFHYFW